MRQLADLLRHHIATPAAPLPPAAPGICWIWAANGRWKLAQDAHTTVLVLAGDAPEAPGLAPLLPFVAWHGYPRRLPGRLLAAMLTHARKAAAPTGGGLLRPIEAQYHVTLEGDQLRVRVPPQEATPGRVRYEPPQGVPILLDLHSHHGMPAFFSGTDNADDTGLGVSAVVGRIFDRPEIAVRLCCYGHTMRIPATMIFDHLAGCRDSFDSTALVLDFLRRRYADPDD